MKKQRASPVNIRKVIRAAAEAALEEPVAVVRPKKRRLSAGRAVLLGAGLVTAGRLLAGRGSGLLGSVQDRLSGLGVNLPGKVPVETELDDEELVDVPEEALDDVLEDEPDEEPDAAEERDLEDEKQSDGGAPQRQPRRQRRGRT